MSYCLERGHLELEINTEQLCMDDCLLFFLFADNKTNNSDAVCSWWRRYPCVPANEECTGLSLTMTVALLWNFCDVSYLISTAEYVVRVFLSGFLEQLLTHTYTCSAFVQLAQGATTGGWGSGPPENLDGPPQLFYEECDYRYITDCSARNWVYHPYFVLYNNLDQEIGPPSLKSWLRPWVSLNFQTNPGWAWLGRRI